MLFVAYDNSAEIGNKNKATMDYKLGLYGGIRRAHGHKETCWIVDLSSSSGAHDIPPTCGIEIREPRVVRGLLTQLGR